LTQVTFGVEDYAIDSLMLADKLQILQGFESLGLWAFVCTIPLSSLGICGM